MENRAIQFKQNLESSLAGNPAPVTGASRGIGAAIGRLFALRSAKVAVHVRDTERRPTTWRGRHSQ